MHGNNRMNTYHNRLIDTIGMCGLSMIACGWWLMPRQRTAQAHRSALIIMRDEQLLLREDDAELQPGSMAGVVIADFSLRTQGWKCFAVSETTSLTMKMSVDDKAAMVFGTPDLNAWKHELARRIERYDLATPAWSDWRRSHVRSPVEQLLAVGGSRTDVLWAAVLSLLGVAVGICMSAYSGWRMVRRLRSAYWTKAGRCSQCGYELLNSNACCSECGNTTR